MKSWRTKKDILTILFKDHVHVFVVMHKLFWIFVEFFDFWWIFQFLSNFSNLMNFQLLCNFSIFDEFFDFWINFSGIFQFLCNFSIFIEIMKNGVFFVFTACLNRCSFWDSCVWILNLCSCFRCNTQTFLNFLH
jgi:hypothetical protein